MSEFLLDASGHWKLDFGTLDLDLSRNIAAFSCLTFHPFFGLRAAWIRQDYSLDTHGVTLVAVTESEPLAFNQASSVDLHHKFTGIGFNILHF